MRLIAFVIALALGACQTPCTNDPARGERLVFSCGDGSNLEAVFGGGEVQVQQSGHAPLLLPSRYAASGYRYARDGAELRGRGGRAIWSRPGAGDVACTAPLRGA